MYFATLLLSLLSLKLAVSLPNPDPDSTDLTDHYDTKRATAGWCTLHYVQYTTNRGAGVYSDSRLTVYGESGAALPPAFPFTDGAFAILLGYGDMLVATNDASDNVTFTRHGTVSGDTWTVLQTDLGNGLDGHACSVGGWYYHTSRSMDCGFQCTPYTGPYTT
ncbi:hypothetical protein IMSHALPRED_003546 [Imshaugia aleurites]|uniref:Uncharacterized protein n=1 Tax=Imshaugia aleurites TaxID=172621 RepID=A0A8H3I737_9LECA|nr:hypothetical protein IMSHALPRED_003546 [Imshaugia aleurites]